MKHENAMRNFTILHEPANFHPYQLSEGDVINLHEMFLTSGIHHIHVADIEQGRSLLMLLLQSLNCFHSIAALSLSKLPLGQSTLDIYQELLEGGYLELDTLDHYFIDHCYVDFLWIEITQELLEASWFTIFEQKLLDITRNSMVPIIKLSYTN